MRAGFILRVRIILALVCLFAAVLLVRLYFVQIVYGEEYAALAEGQYVRPNQNLYDRGSVFFEDKDERLIAAATLRTGYMLVIHPERIEDPTYIYNKLVRALEETEYEIDKESFIERASKEDDPYEEILHEVEEVVAEKIKDLDLTGVSLFRERWRYYPGDTLASRSLGFVAFDETGENKSGRYGLERYYNDTLKRTTHEVRVNFFADLFSNISESIKAEERKRAGDVVTTVEPSVQLFLENRLAELSNEWSSNMSGAIIMDPNDGSIYALAVDPSYNVNKFGEVDDTKVFGNPLVENVYEMGSIVKAITVAIGLDAGAIIPDTLYDDTGSIKLDGYTIRNYDGKARGMVDMQQVLNQSLNTGVSFIVQETGQDIFAKYLHEFGLGEETGIDLPNEIPGIIHNLESPRLVEYATASFGQGIALTPVATIRALSALANGGKLVTPHLAKEIRYESGDIKKVGFPPDEQVIKPETSEEITRMLVKVVDDALRGGTVKKEHYAIAAKTGTAQIAKTDERGYYDDRYLHSFFGYFPAYEPRFLVFLYTIEPKGARYASESLTAPFMDIVNYLINYYEIPPDR